MCRTLEGHGHWVNSLALNSDYVIRTGAFDPKDASFVKNDISNTPSTIIIYNKSIRIILNKKLN